MGRLIYSAVLFILLPLLFLRLWFKGKKSPDYRQRWRERLGFIKPPVSAKNGICFHCVSVGETLAAIKLIKEVQTQFPNIPITITSTTPTGSVQVKTAFGETVYHCYLPFDAPGAVSRFFSKLQPKLLIIMETELWPNLLFYAKRNQCKTILANARLSEKSAAGYQKISGLSKQMMDNIHLIAAHNAQDGERFVQLGLSSKKLTITGSIKFDIELDNKLAADCIALKSDWAPERAVWVVGSTHLGEDEIVLDAFAEVLEQQPDTLMVLVPRHPERFNQVADLIESRGFSFVRRSVAQTPSQETQIVLGDTMGELKLFWGIADIAFVGGSLVERGGHNPLEPALFSTAIISGHHTFNFKQIYQLLEKQNAVICVNDQQTLANSVIDLLDSHDDRQQLGNNAAQVLEQNRGALAKLKAQLIPLLSSS